MSVGDMLEKLYDAVKNDRTTGLPLIFHPKNQIACQRATNQDAVYLAQMDLRCDLVETWSNFEHSQRLNEKTFLKIVLPKGFEVDCKEWLEHNGIIRNFIYPDL